MRVLFDQGTPVPLRNYLPEHKVTTAAEMGWSTLSNGELLDAAEREFDLLVTTDQALRSQQHLSKRRIAILVLPFASWPRLEPHAETLPSQFCVLSRKSLSSIETQPLPSLLRCYPRSFTFYLGNPFPRFLGS